jgi:hypothetical protein
MLLLQRRRGSVGAQVMGAGRWAGWQPKNKPKTQKQQGLGNWESLHLFDLKARKWLNLAIS